MKSLLLLGVGIFGFSTFAHAADPACTANAFVSSERWNNYAYSLIPGSTLQKIKPSSKETRYLEDNGNRFLSAFTCEDSNGLPVNLSKAIGDDYVAKGEMKISKISYEYGGKNYEYLLKPDDLGPGNDPRYFDRFSDNLLSQDYDQGNPLLKDLGKKVGKKPKLKDVIFTGMAFLKAAEVHGGKGRRKT